LAFPVGRLEDTPNFKEQKWEGQFQMNILSQTGEQGLREKTKNKQKNLDTSGLLGICNFFNSFF